jgi:hypothetical protein
MSSLYVSARALYRDMGYKHDFSAWFDSKRAELDLIPEGSTKLQHGERADYRRITPKSSCGRPREIIILTEEAAWKIVRSCRGRPYYQIPEKLRVEYEYLSPAGKTTTKDAAKLFGLKIPALKKIYFSPENPLPDPDRWYENRLIEVDIENIALVIKKAENRKIIKNRHKLAEKECF